MGVLLAGDASGRQVVENSGTAMSGVTHSQGKGRRGMRNEGRGEVEGGSEMLGRGVFGGGKREKAGE